MGMRFRQSTIAATIVLAAAGGLQPAGQAPGVKSALFDAPQLLLDLKTLSADDMEGRQVGTAGGAKAREYLTQRFVSMGLQPGTQEFKFTSNRGGQATEITGVNLLVGVKGTRTPDRYLVVSAHYDHIGVRNGTVFNGADDNASGAAALLTVAKYFASRKPANSLMFLALDGEESGLRGARAFVLSPPVPASAMAINLNMDMIGRDPKDLLYVVGTRQQPFLKPFIERIAAKAPVKLVMGHDDPKEKEDWTGDSDHKAFCDAKIPCLYFGVEDFDQHHRATDDFETMTHGFYVRAVETMIRAIEEFDSRLDELQKARGGKAPRP
jgi:hypothetical protein